MRQALEELEYQYSSLPVLLSGVDIGRILRVISSSDSWRIASSYVHVLDPRSDRSKMLRSRQSSYSALNPLNLFWHDLRSLYWLEMRK